jgi:hypothetical protein
MRNRIEVGSEEHKELFCRVFIESHDPYDPAAIEWPELDEESLRRLRTLPFWGEALATEGSTARKVQAQAGMETDALLREAVALQGFEEERHASLLRLMTRRYGIPVAPAPEEPPAGSDVEWEFLRTGYGECFDSFFAFGLFALARDSGFFAPALVERFEPIMQEEARHILFFVNWVAYLRARRRLRAKPRHVARCGRAMMVQVWSRFRAVRGSGEGNFTLTGHESFTDSVSPRAFIQTCLRENEKRLGRYDERLLRPRLVPTIAKTLCRVVH